MGALGAAAGAFEGDNAREEQSLRRAQLASQNAANAARLNMQGYQFEAARADAESARADAAARDQRNFDESKLRADLERTDTLAQRGEQKRQFDLTNSRADVQTEIAQKASTWDSALKDQELQDRQLRIKANRLQFEELDRASKQEREQLANRQQIAKTGLGALALAAMKNGGIASQSAIELFNKQQAQAGTGIKVSGGVWSADGFAFKRRGPGQDQSGRPIETDYDEVLSPAIAQAIFKDEFGEDVAKEQSTSQHENARYANAQNVAAIRSANTGKKAPLSPQEELYKLSGALKDMDADNPAYDLVVGRLNQLKQTIQPNAGNTGGAAVESPDVAAERARLTKIAQQTKKPAEQQAYVDSGLAKFSKTYSAKSEQPADTPNDAANQDYKTMAEKAMTDANGNRDEAIRLFKLYKGGAADKTSSSVKKTAPSEKPTPSAVGPTQDDPAYWRDMPVGRSPVVVVEDPEKDIPKKRWEILARLEAAYRMPKTAEKKETVRRIKAELDSFNSVNPI